MCFFDYHNCLDSLGSGSNFSAACVLRQFTCIYMLVARRFIRCLHLEQKRLAQIPSGKLRQLTTFNIDNSGNPDQIIVNLSWFPRRQKLLFTYRGDIYTLIPNKLNQPVALTITDSREIASAVSPDGKNVSFIRDNTLRLIGVKEGREIQLSHTMQGNRLQKTDVCSDNGTLFLYRWSPSGRQIAIPDFVGNYAQAILIFNLATDRHFVHQKI